MCKHWRENEYGESCLVMERECSCAGDIGGCRDQRFYNAEGEVLGCLRDEKRIETDTALFEPFVRAERGL